MFELDRLVERFIAGTLPRREWTHAAHLAVGLWHVHKYGAEEALSRLRAGIQQLNDSHGTLNSPTSGYHETITRAYVGLLTEFLERCPARMPLQGRVTSLLTSALADKEVLFAYWSRENLMSKQARQEWVEPDLAPLEMRTP